MRTGVADFTLDWGKCPSWLFTKMVNLSRAIGIAIISEFGPEEFLKRLADPVWFQSFGCILAFDWNASGLTTTTLGALKVAFKETGKDYDFFICGGKGGTSRKTPDEIQNWGQILHLDKYMTDRLEYSSRAAAKVDSALIQDGFTLYHHSFLFTKSGKWSVIQQGMNTKISCARRYHWLGDYQKRFIEEPHQGIASQAFLSNVVNLTSRKSSHNRNISVELINSPKTFLKDIKILNVSSNSWQFKILSLPNQEFYHHPVEKEKTSFQKPLGALDTQINLESPKLHKHIQKAIIKQPSTFEQLLMTKNVGAKTIRAISLVAELIYNAPVSYQDPARYTFAHGGKDGTPYFIDQKTYNHTIDIMEQAIKKAYNVSFREKEQALRQLEKRFILPQYPKKTF